jgi:hypothetical protein
LPNWQDAGQGQQREGPDEGSGQLELDGHLGPFYFSVGDGGPTWQHWWERWSAAMPDSLKELKPEAWQHVVRRNDVTPVLEALSQAYPDPAARILALFRWFGCGAGPWTAFPVYEEIAEGILMQFPDKDLVNALQSATLTDDQLEGASRFFAGQSFANRSQGKGVRLIVLSLKHSDMGAFLTDQPGEPALIPGALRQRLLEHCLKSENEAKRRRAKAAFAT